MRSFFIPKLCLKKLGGSTRFSSRASCSQLCSCCREESMMTPSQSKMAAQLCMAVIGSGSRGKGKPNSKRQPLGEHHFQRRRNLLHTSGRCRTTLVVYKDEFVL